MPGADELAAPRARVGLVEQLPERPRRFLLRLVLGHSYREIAADERVSLTTTSHQIARAKRLLRAADVDAKARPQDAGQPGRKPGAAGVAPTTSACSR